MSVRNRLHGKVLNVRREMHGFERVSRTKKHRTLHEIAQLSHVARETVSVQEGLCAFS